MINKPVIVLAGGLGSRLQPILKGLPKPLADINGKPFIYYLIKNLITQGFDHFIFSLCFESDKIIQYLKSNKNILFKNCKFDYCTEPVPLGTGGAIAYILNNIKLPNNFFIVNADTLVNNGYDILNSYEDNVIGILKVDNCSRYGMVYKNEYNIITKFEEKKNINETGFINIGVYKLNSSIFMNWNGLPFSLENDLFPDLVKNNKLKGVEVKTDFIDIGIPEDYHTFCRSNNDNI